MEIEDLNVWEKQERKKILKNINIKIKRYSVVAIIGPSGSGKSSLLKAINQISFECFDYCFSGSIIYENYNILSDEYSKENLRMEIGTVLQSPVVFPMSIRENILFAAKACGVNDNDLLENLLQQALEEVYLWDEVKDRLNSNPQSILSIGQQQRLCIARAIILKPKILLMDEPTSALDIKSSSKIEELVLKISEKKSSTIILISHSLSQVKRISNYTIFIKDGEVIEHGDTKSIFTNPVKKATRDFISGGNC